MKIFEASQGYEIDKQGFNKRLGCQTRSMLWSLCCMFKQISYTEVYEINNSCVVSQFENSRDAVLYQILECKWILLVYSKENLKNDFDLWMHTKLEADLQAIRVVVIEASRM